MSLFTTCPEQRRKVTPKLQFHFRGNVRRSEVFAVVAKQIVLLSGRVSAGKSTLCDQFVERFGAHILKTKEIIEELAKRIEAERGAMQRYGELLDRRTNGQWVCEALARKLEGLSDNALVVVDAVRIMPQIEAIRRAYGARVYHVHLEAEKAVLANRYQRKQRLKGFKEFGSYSQLSSSKTEKRIGELAASADVVIKTDRCTKEDVLVRAAGHLGLYGRECERLVDVLVGGEYGSEGKGHIASYLSKEYQILIRVGGPNAGHKVYEDPKPYTHHQLPCGTRCSTAQLVIGPGAVLSIPGLLKEIAECSVQRDRLFIDPQAMIIEDSDRKRESKSIVKSIGSTGQGVGAATARKIMRGADRTRVRLARHVKELKPFLHETRDVLDRAFGSGQRVFLEGTQGTGLSLHHGYYPHVTSRDTTVAGCLAEAGISPGRVRKAIMVCRSYPIRVQNPSRTKTSGPMSQPLTWKEIANRSGIAESELRRVEKTSTTHRKRRVSEFDWNLLRRAVSLNVPTDIALTFADYIRVENRKARRFEQLTEDTIMFIEEIERVASAPVSLISTQFGSRSIIDRRSW
jgi:adenylosuccinate synthase